MTEWMPLLMLVMCFAFLLIGFPVAFSLAGSALLFAGIGLLTGDFDGVFISAIPNRLFGIMFNETLMAVPLFVFMGVLLEKSKISEDLLKEMSLMFGSLKGGLGVAVCIVGGLLAASTGIVGATVVTMGLISLPTMLSHKYDPKYSTGIICASGTLGQIIPPSIVLVVLGDVIGTAFQQAQIDQGIFNPEAISVGDLFKGALVPGALLMSLYLIYTLIMAHLNPEKFPKIPYQKSSFKNLLKVLVAPLLLILGVLGSILLGVATPTEAASIGGVGALLLSLLKKNLKIGNLKQACNSTTHITCMVFSILIGASIFSLVFRGFEGDEWIRDLLLNFEDNVYLSFWIVMLVIFLLGFFLDFFEITFVIVPVVGPSLLAMGIDPVWLGVMIAINLQTSFLTPPFGFSLFYLRGVMPKSIKTTEMYKGVLPFICIQVFLILILFFFPSLITWGK